MWNSVSSPLKYSRVRSAPPARLRAKSASLGSTVFSIHCPVSPPSASKAVRAPENPGKKTRSQGGPRGPLRGGSSHVRWRDFGRNRRNQGAAFTARPGPAARNHCFVRNKASFAPIPTFPAAGVPSFVLGSSPAVPSRCRKDLPGKSDVWSNLTGRHAGLTSITPGKTPLPDGMCRRLKGSQEPKTNAGRRVGNEIVTSAGDAVFLVNNTCMRP